MTPNAASLPLLLCLAWSSVAQAQTCDDIKADIQSRIRGATSGFVLNVVDAAASAPGRVVGTCGQGSKKIVYVAGAAGSAGSAVPARSGPPSAASAASWPASGPRPWTVPAGTLPRPRPRPASAAPAPRPPADNGILTECLDGTVQQGGDCKP